MAKSVMVIGSGRVVEDVRGALSRIVSKVETAGDEAEIRQKVKKAHIDIIVFDLDYFAFTSGSVYPRIVSAIRQTGKKFIFISSQRNPTVVLEAKELGASDYIVKPYNTREFVARLNAIVQKKTRISCIGGGTGLFTLLLGLKMLPDVLLTSIVNMSDSGGSSGKLRASFGILPPGDIRRSLVGLSNAPELMNQIIQYRFQRGGELQDHSFGNLFLTVLTELKGSMSEAVRTLGDILNIQGIVLPVTSTLTQLVARFEDGTVIEGESKIDQGEGRSPNLRITELWHHPEPECDINAFASIINSDLVTIGPGDLYTSVIASASIRGIREALTKTAAKKAYICNLMTKPGETAGYRAVDHIKEIVKYLGEACLDYILISNTQFSKEALLGYSKNGQVPVEIGPLDEIKRLSEAKVILSDIGHETELVRHDSDKIGIEIQKIIKELR